MKFTNGFWLKRPGVEIFNATDIREMQVENDKVTLFVSPWEVTNRGRSMDGPLLTLEFTSPQPDIIAVHVWHFMGSARKEPAFDIADQKCALTATDENGEIVISNGNMTVKMTKFPFDMRFYYKGRLLTSLGDRHLGWAKTPEGAFIRVQMDMGVGEKVYGLGERFSPFVKNGQTVDIWNEDGGTASEISYKNIPFYITNKGYGVFVNSTDKVSYEVCSEAISRTQFSVPGEHAQFMVIGGDEPKDVLVHYTDLTGKPALPPSWTFGLWLTTSFTTNYDEETVNSFVDGMRERNIPLHVFHFDCYWMKAYEWCNFSWDNEMFGDVEGMMKRLKNDKHLHLCAWINPYIGQKSPLFKEGMEHGYLLRRPNGDVWQWDLWQPGLAVVDFTNPDACKWYQSYLKKLLDVGIDCFKTDFGERIPTDVVYYDGSDPVLMHNYYTYLYNKVVFDLLEEVKGHNEAVVFARSATVGGQKFPVHWGGDCSSTFPSMAESLRGGLSLTLSGFGFWSHDMSGFELTATPEVYKRWTAFGLLSTHSRLHGNSSYRVPWLFDPEGSTECVDVCRFFSEYKCRLMPYLYSNAVITNQTGIPSMRAMLLEFPHDLGCQDLDRQYMLGDSLLVAPVFREDNVADYYLPAGRWTHMFSNKEVEGGSWRSETFDFFSLPFYARENSIIPLGGNNQEPVYDYGKDLELYVFALKDEASFTVYDSSANKMLTVKAVRCGDKVTVSFDGRAENLKLVLHNVKNVQNVEGAVAHESELGTVLDVNAGLADVCYTEI